MMVLERSETGRPPLKPELRIIGREAVTMRSVKQPRVVITRDAGKLFSAVPHTLAPTAAKEIGAPLPDADIRQIVVHEVTVASPTRANDNLAPAEPGQTKRKTGWFARLFGGAR